MQINVNGRVINLTDSQVAKAKNTSVKYLSSMKEKLKNQPDLYLTHLIVLHALTGELISGFDPDVLEQAMKIFYDRNN